MAPSVAPALPPTPWTTTVATTAASPRPPSCRTMRPRGRRRPPATPATPASPPQLQEGPRRATEAGTGPGPAIGWSSLLECVRPSYRWEDEDEPPHSPYNSIEKGWQNPTRLPTMWCFNLAIKIDVVTWKWRIPPDSEDSVVLTIRMCSKTPCARLSKGSKTPCARLRKGSKTPCARLFCFDARTAFGGAKHGWGDRGT